MKKCVLAVSVLVAALTWACSGNQQEAKAENDFKAKIENCTNPDSLAVYIQQASEYAQKLAAEGKTEEAQKFIDELAPVVAAQDSTLGGQWMTVVETVEVFTENAVDTAKAVAAEAVDSAKTVVSNAKDSVAAKAGNVVDKVKEGVSNAAEKATDKVEETAKKGVDAVKQAGSDVAKKAADEASKLGNKFKK